MSAPIKKKEENKQESVLTQFNQQNNILVENELNAIAKLHHASPELADRAMKLLETNIEHRNQCDKEVIAIEKQEQNMREKDMKSYYRWIGFGSVASYIFPLVIFGGGVWLTMNGYTNQGWGAIGFSFVFSSPKILGSFKKKPKTQNAS